MNKTLTNILVVAGAIGGAFIGKWAVEGVFTDTKDYSKILMNAANELNKNLPMMVDSETQLVSTIGYGDSFKYLYKLSNSDVSEINIVEFKKHMEPNLHNSVCSSDAMSEFRKMRIKVTYSYMDANSKQIVDIPIDTKDCEKA